MLFQTVEFAVFFLCVAVSYFLVRHHRRPWILLLASDYFYMAWDYRFAALILGSTLVDWEAGPRESRPRKAPSTSHWNSNAERACRGSTGRQGTAPYFAGTRTWAATRPVACRAR